MRENERQFVRYGLGIAALAACLCSSAGCVHHRSDAAKPDENGVTRSSGGVTYAGGDGSSFETAIVVRGARGGADGVDAEYGWLRQHYPGYRMNRQSLTSHEKKWYDILHVTTGDGKESTFYFDISEFFGKY